MIPITYPARPVNGGSLDRALPKSGHWIYEPKYNGWRALVHIATGQMFNRKGELLSIAGDFRRALNSLRLTLDCEAFKWADCEALERRHHLGRGTLIILDVVPEPAQRAATYEQRRSWLAPVVSEASVNSRMADNIICLAPQVPGNLETWKHLQSLNHQLKGEFYEGLVAKRADSVYPIQLRSPDQEFPFWMKHRWRF